MRHAWADSKTLMVDANLTSAGADSIASGGDGSSDAFMVPMDHRIVQAVSIALKVDAPKARVRADLIEGGFGCG